MNWSSYSWRALVLYPALCVGNVASFSNPAKTSAAFRIRTYSQGLRNNGQLYLMPDSVEVVQHTFAALPNLPMSAADVSQNALDALGHDIFVFLATSVIVVPLCKALKITPVLGFLAVGCLIGPYGLQIFSNSEADIELGDFGILFLLFNEGLSLSADRIKELGKFTGLGVFQLLISIGMIFVGTFWGGPVILKYVQEIGIPFDVILLRPIVDNPVQSFCIAAAGALSSSAFVLPVLKEKEWEDRPEGIAGLSILLLQDLAVAPLLVILPLLAGSGPSTSVDLGILVTKATLGFGALLAAGSYVLRYVFEVVAATRSTETFVAAALLVAVGMGQAADSLGLSASTGAFAAGVLLAGNRYRAQIQADIKPFEGILLGLFFLTAGANLNPSFVITEWLTLLSGILVFIAVKAAIIFASGPALGLTRGEAARVSLTLAGGGEFALVLFKLAEDLNVLPGDIARLLDASVIISMSLTPLLGNLGDFAGDLIDGKANNGKKAIMSVEQAASLFDNIDTDRSGSIELDELRTALLKLNFSFASIAEVFAKFDSNNDGVIDRDEWRAGAQAGFLSEAWNTNVEIGVTDDKRIFAKDALMILGYGELGQSIVKTFSATFKKEKGGLICFDLNPSRVTAGVLSGDPVVYGDGAKFELLKAAGVTKPRAVLVTFASDTRRIEATMRLRSCLPDDTPIYVYEGNSRIGQDLLDAGATEVISETIETVLRFGTLIGVCQTPEVMSRLRSQSFEKFGLIDNQDGEDPTVRGLSDEYLLDLADQVGVSKREIMEQWEFFNSIASEGDSVSIKELKELLLIRSGSNESGVGEFLQSCLDMEDEDGEGELTFVEYVRAYWRDCSFD
jgi:Kef-type K+ transport system membrane component KefB/Ca2+-binding EF-hand superfamily protein/voltage-gated potassium channel Kch